MEKLNTITLDEDVILALINAGEGFKTDLSEAWEDWYIEPDTDKGEFDAEKGSMTNYMLTLISPNGKEWRAYAGYYNAIAGHNFYRPVTFKFVEPQRDLLEIVNDLDDLINKAPMDFLGTGSDSAYAEKEESEWWANWDNLLTELRNK